MFHHGLLGGYTSDAVYLRELRSEDHRLWKL